MVKIGINPCPANMFEIVLRFVWCDKNALIDFVISLHNKLHVSSVKACLNELLADLVKKMMESVLPHRLLLLAMSRQRAMNVVSPASLDTLSPIEAPLR